MKELPKTDPQAAVSCSSGPLEAGRTSGDAAPNAPQDEGSGGYALSTIALESCAKCAFWDCLQSRWGGAYDDCDTSALAHRGACMRYPPQRLKEPGALYLPLVDASGEKTGETEEVTYIETDFPTTNDHDWCGEFRKKPTSPTASAT